MSTQGTEHPVWRRIGWGILIIALILFVLSVGSWFWFKYNQPKIVEPLPSPLAIFNQPLPPGPNSALLERGRYLTIAGDCVSCHTRKGGLPFEGGLGLRTPFGIIYSPNITGNRTTGLGKWTNAQFYKALTTGVSADGDHLYPAFPYPHFTIVSRHDADAIFAYLKTVPGGAFTPPANRLPFPIDLRLSALAWQEMFFVNRVFRPNPSRSQLWNRGAYLVQGLGHCGACHTPKNALGAEQSNQRLQGAKIDNWIAPDLTGNARTGLGSWTKDELVQYLQTGRNVHTDAAGSMAEVISYSTSQLSRVDLEAIATYLKSLPASARSPIGQPPKAAMLTGAHIYADACTACHRVGGKGRNSLFPQIQGSAVVQQPDPTSVIRLLLAGGRAGPTRSRPTPVAMPAFAWKLSDQQIADVATFVRNSWGNRAPAVSKDAVADLRRKLELPHTLQSGRGN